VRHASLMVNTLREATRESGERWFRPRRGRTEAGEDSLRWTCGDRELLLVLSFESLLSYYKIIHTPYGEDLLAEGEFEEEEVTGEFVLLWRWLAYGIT
jgi:hypothetical protein